MHLKNLLSVFLAALLVMNGALAAAAANQDQKIYWGPVQTGVYDLEFPILNEQGEDTGFDLQTQKMTKNNSARDFKLGISSPKFTYYMWGSGSRKGGRVLYDQQLSDPIERVSPSAANFNFLISEDVQVGDLILLITSDETFAKIQIDKITATKIHFSYALEAEAPVTPAPAPQPIQQPTPSSSGNAYQQGNKIFWGPIQTGIYDLEFPILNEQGEDTGFDLQTQKMTKNNSARDLKLGTSYPKYTFYMWGSGSRKGGRVLYDQQLSDPTERVSPSSANFNFLISEDVQVGDIILLITSDETFAKIQIDKITATKIHFSYVLETEAPASAAPTPIATTPAPQPNPVPSQAASGINLFVGNAQANVNGQQMRLDVPPVVVNGSTMVPLRFIAEALGANVVWNGNEKSISLTLNGESIILWVDQSKALVNGRSVNLAVPAQIIQSTTMVPVRFISENLKQQVQYDNATKKITISSH